MILKIKSILVVALMSLSLSVFGQKYQVHRFTSKAPVRIDEAAADTIIKKGTDTLSLGTVINVTSVNKNLCKAFFNYKGGLKAIDSKYLTFSEENPEGTADILEGISYDSDSIIKIPYNSKIIPLLYSNNILYAVIILIAIVTVFIFLIPKKVPMVNLIGSLTCLFLAVGIEVFAYMVIGSDVSWFCASRDMKWGGMMLRFIPFAIVGGIQIFSFKWVKDLILDEIKTNSYVTGALGIWSIVGGLVVLLVTLIALSSSGQSEIVQLFAIIGIVAVVLILQIIQMVKNIKELGLDLGIVFTLFTIVYTFGTIIIAILLISCLIKAIMPILIALVGFGVLAWLFGSHIENIGGRYYRVDNFDMS